MTAPGRLAKYVGFTENEVRYLCKEYDMPFSEAKKWYDGYRFKQASHVYNPKSIIDEVHSANTAPDLYNNEQALRAVIMLAYISRIDDYSTIQELPSGNGYADIVFLPKKHSRKPAMVVELKWDHSAEGAIAQIKEKKYIAAIEDYGGDILLVGVNYDKNSRKHTCVIEKHCKNKM